MPTENVTLDCRITFDAKRLYRNFVVFRKILRLYATRRKNLIRIIQTLKLYTTKRQQAECNDAG